MAHPGPELQFFAELKTVEFNAAIVYFRSRGNIRPKGENAYRLHVPPYVPAKQYWTVTVYDLDTACHIRDMPSPQTRRSSGEIGATGPENPDEFDTFWQKARRYRPFGFHRELGQTTKTTHSGDEQSRVVTRSRPASVG